MTGRGPASPNTVRWLIGGFLVAVVAVTVWGFFVVEEARQVAYRTDREVRAVAWRLLAMADRDGSMPDSESRLADADGLELPGMIASPDGQWPATPEAAGIDADGGTFNLASDQVRVVFEADRPPRVTVVGLPTRNGTLDEVNRWIEAWAEAHGPAAAR